MIYGVASQDGPMALEQRDISIIAQSAAHDAAQIYSGTSDLGNFLTAHGLIFEHTLKLIEAELEQRAIGNVVQTFPGAEVVRTPGPSSFTPDDLANWEPPQPPVPQQTYAPPPPPQGPPAAPAGAGGFVPSCPRCNGPMFDNTRDNARRRAGGYKLSADYKCKDRNCKNDRGNQPSIWPPDYDNYKNNPLEPRQ